MDWWWVFWICFKKTHIVDFNHLRKLSRDFANKFHKQCFNLKKGLNFWTTEPIKKQKLFRNLSETSIIINISPFGAISPIACLFPQQNGQIASNGFNSPSKNKNLPKKTEGSKQKQSIHRNRSANLWIPKTQDGISLTLNNPLPIRRKMEVPPTKPHVLLGASSIYNCKHPSKIPCRKLETQLKSKPIIRIREIEAAATE